LASLLGSHEAEIAVCAAKALANLAADADADLAAHALLHALQCAGGSADLDVVVALLASTVEVAAQLNPQDGCRRSTRSPRSS
jgi:hypothetical protein